MRRVAFAAVTAVLAAAVASCNDKPGPVEPANLSPSATQVAQGSAGKVTICHAAGTASDPRFAAIKVSNAAPSAHFDEHGTPRAGHEHDYLVTARTPCPPPAAPGEVRVCKVNGGGVPFGTFDFLINGVTETVAVGLCVTRLYPVGTRVTVTEVDPVSADTKLTQVTVTPALAGTTDLAAASARVVAGTDVAIITFTNVSQTFGAIVVCKVAGTGISVGTPFDILLNRADGLTLVGINDLPAGAGPTGTCSEPVAWGPTPDNPTGDALIGEPSVTGAAVTGISVSPTGNFVESDLSLGYVRVKVVANQTTTVTFTNTSTVGAIVVCKVAGTGISVGTPFDILLDDANGLTQVGINDLPAGAGPTGTCSNPVPWGPTPGNPTGDAIIVEPSVPGTAVTGISVSPTANIVSSTTSSVRVKVVANQTTTVTFTNTSTVGAIVVCKVAGTGVSVGTPFDILLDDANGLTQVGINDLPAGAGPTGNCSNPVPWGPTSGNPTGDAIIVEPSVPGTSVAGITVSPAANLVTSGTSSVRVKVIANQTTTVTFTNTSSQ